MKHTWDSEMVLVSSMCLFVCFPAVNYIFTHALLLDGSIVKRVEDSCLLSRGCSPLPSISLAPRIREVSHLQTIRA